MILFVLQEAKEMADENGLLFTETSAKTGLSIEEMFINIGKKK